jgi:hypothetical protein
MGATDDTDGRLLWRVRIHPSGPSVPSVASVASVVNGPEAPPFAKSGSATSATLGKDPGQPPPPLVAKTKQKRPCLFWPRAGERRRVVEKAGGKLEHQSLRKLRFVVQAVDALSEPLLYAGGQ